MSEIPFFTTRAAFAMRVSRLSSLLYEQMERCLVSRGLRLRGYTTSIVQTLHHAGPQSITELAGSLQLSHQLASQRVRWLVGEGFATIERGAQDRRRRIVTLTADGSAEAEKLRGFLPCSRLPIPISSMRSGWTWTGLSWTRPRPWPTDPWRSGATPDDTSKMSPLTIRQIRRSNL